MIHQESHQKEHNIRKLQNSGFPLVRPGENRKEVHNNSLSFFPDISQSTQLINSFIPQE